mmetsp:Transcript_7412/g.19763  ORF Transcript_7412/g.19763 Transcript_7412/m.19763 type:complete len:208 (-) Transcript_7412:1027-1650(-)
MKRTWTATKQLAWTVPKRLKCSNSACTCTRLLLPTDSQPRRYLLRSRHSLRPRRGAEVAMSVATRLAVTRKFQACMLPFQCRRFCVESGEDEEPRPGRLTFLRARSNHLLRAFCLLINDAQHLLYAAESNIALTSATGTPRKDLHFCSYTRGSRPARPIVHVQHPMQVTRKATLRLTARLSRASPTACTSPQSESRWFLPHGQLCES